MIKVGFELEAFCIDRLTTKPTLVPNGYGLPYDECGWLVEVRSEPHNMVRKAMALFKEEIEIVKEQAAKSPVYLDFTPLMEIPRDLKVKAARLYTKGRLAYRNLYGFETHRCSTKLATASLHISFTNDQTFHYDYKGKSSEFKYPGFMDHARIIHTLDKAFKDEIRKAKRNPGFYEVKGDGRIEYRSLPNDVDLQKVEDVLSKLVANL